MTTRQDEARGPVLGTLRIGQKQPFFLPFDTTMPIGLLFDLARLRAYMPVEQWLGCIESVLTIGPESPEVKEAHRIALQAFSLPNAHETHFANGGGAMAILHYCAEAAGYDAWITSLNWPDTYRMNPTNAWGIVRIAAHAGRKKPTLHETWVNLDEILRNGVRLDMAWRPMPLAELWVELLTSRGHSARAQGARDRAQAGTNVYSASVGEDDLER